MVTGIHFLLTYTCNSECDHCFLYCGPDSTGTFTLRQIKKVLGEATKIGTVEWVYFEGGEPFLFYPVMLEGIRAACEMGFKTGIVSNAYWATSTEDAELWLKPLCQLGVSDLSLSDDLFHHENGEDNPAKLAVAAAKKLGMPVNTICIEEPTVEKDVDREPYKGAPIIGGSTMFKGRAVEKLTEGLPRRPWEEFTECSHEDLENPKRLHIDPFGNVHLCQGVSMGNVWKTPLSLLVRSYDALSHPISGPLVKGGPARLAKEYDVNREDQYVDECHLCYLVRLALMDRFPHYLTPRQVYGLK